MSTLSPAGLGEEQGVGGTQSHFFQVEAILGMSERPGDLKNSHHFYRIMLIQFPSYSATIIFFAAGF